MINLKNFINPMNKSGVDEYGVTDFDNPGGWNWKDVDHLLEMGFKIEGETRLKLTDNGDFNNTLNVEIYKQKSTKDYIMILNERKHVFRGITELLNFIDSQNSD